MAIEVVGCFLENTKNQINLCPKIIKKSRLKV